MGVRVTVQLVGPSWGSKTAYTSATTLRTRQAAQRVQAEYERSGTCANCKPVDVRLALAARGTAVMGEPTCQSAHMNE